MPLLPIRPIIHVPHLFGSYIQASTIASSSRFYLALTSPVRAEPPRLSTTLLNDPQSRQSTSRDLPPHESQAENGQSKEGKAPPAASSSSQTRTTPPRTTPPPSPLFNLTSSSTKSAKKRKGEPKILRFNPEDTSGDHQALTHTLTVSSSRNNVTLTFTDGLGPLFGTITGGTGKVFKKSNRNSYEAAHQASLKMISRIVEYSRDAGERIRMRVAFKGMFGNGREAVSNALGGNEGTEVRGLIARVEDRTPLVISGTRSRKRRRI
ncbi:MAG: hypothetical protein TREMPRED_005245 [Tremellales sp. Tagirdzhanova-0007]|nr:MAG: hypothetical protein TREMPRED_005245 [Tremellales sp. Tagirdzhanova-0007]